jgi:hypothetical protein
VEDGRVIGWLVGWDDQALSSSLAHSSQRGNWQTALQASNSLDHLMSASGIHHFRRGVHSVRTSPTLQRNTPDPAPPKHPNTCLPSRWAPSMTRGWIQMEDGRHPGDLCYAVRVLRFHAGQAASRCAGKQGRPNALDAPDPPSSRQVVSVNTIQKRKRSVYTIHTCVASRIFASSSPYNHNVIASFPRSRLVAPACAHSVSDTTQ